MSYRFSPPFFLFASLVIGLSFSLSSCAPATNTDKTADSSPQKGQTVKYPSECIPDLDQWTITLGDGTNVGDLIEFAHTDYFYTHNDGTDWMVFKTPNSGGTTPNSSNTRSELRHKADWKPTEGGKMEAKLKVMHVSTSGDARVAASYSVVIGQIHSSEGHENEPLKIFYKKFPGHSKGSVFWNYEINTEGDNSGRWDYSTAVWGYDMSVLGAEADAYPEEPIDGIALGEELQYEVNVYEGVMYLSFMSKGHPTKTFTKNLLESEYSTYANIPQQILTLFAPIGRDGTEQAQAYTGELQFFKLGAYNQTNGKAPKSNMVWSTGSETYAGSLAEQYTNGSYAEVWFKEAKLSPASAPDSQN